MNQFDDNMQGMSPGGATSETVVHEEDNIDDDVAPRPKRRRQGRKTSDPRGGDSYIQSFLRDCQKRAKARQTSMEVNETPNDAGVVGDVKKTYELVNTKHPTFTKHTLTAGISSSLISCNLQLLGSRLLSSAQINVLPTWNPLDYLRIMKAGLCLGVHFKTQISHSLLICHNFTLDLATYFEYLPELIDLWMKVPPTLQACVASCVWSVQEGEGMRRAARL